MTLTIGVIAILLLIGFASGMLSGLVGVGGGIIIVPCLVFFLAFGQKQAQGTSLAVLTLPVVILGMMQYYKQGYIDYRIALIIAIGFIIGGLFGGKIAVAINDNLLKKIFAVVLIFVGLKILILDGDKEIKNPKTEIQSPK